MNWKFWKQAEKNEVKDDGVRTAPPPSFLRAAQLDVTSQTWAFVVTWAEAQIFNARQKNDSLTLSVDQTAALRGEIRVMKRLLDLAKPQEPVDSGQVED